MSPPASSGNGNGNGNGGNISVRTALYAMVGLIQIVLGGAGYMLWDQLKATHRNVEDIERNVNKMQLRLTEKIGAIEGDIGILKAQQGKR